MIVMNKKIILLLLVLLFVFLHNSIAGQIGEITIEGNNIVPAKEIEKKISLKKGDIYDPAKAGDDLSAIYDMEKFDDVSVFLHELSSDTVRVIYRVEEKPVVEKIEFKGNEKIKSKKLSKKIELKKGEFFDEFIMQDDVNKIEEFYIEDGYAECRVEAYKTIDQQSNSVVVTLYVNEGNRIKVKEINLVGVIKEKHKKVIKQIKTKAGKVFKNQLNEDLENIKTLYKNMGYMNIEVEDPLITYDPFYEFMYITIFISEGNKYLINNISFTGNEKITNDRLREVIGIKKGVLYSEEKLNYTMFSIQELYGLDGYIKMSVIPNYIYDDTNQKLNIEFDIFEGPKVYVRNIYIDGNYVTRDYVIEREFKVKEGEPFNLKKVRRTQGQIFKLGFFSDVQIEMLPTGAPDKTDLVFIVEEQKTGMASVGAGYSSVDKLVGTVKISQDNLFGRGQKISALWEFGTGETKKQNYRIDFTEPYLFNTPTPFGASIYNLIRRRYYKDYGYSELRRGGSLSLGRHFTDEFSSFLKYSLEQVKIYNINTAIKDELEESKDTTSSITPSLSYDKRDYPFDPSTGYLLKASNQIAGGIFGGDRDFIKFEFQGTYFQPVFWRIVGVLNVVTGAVSEYSDSDDVPIYERFNVGGAETIRGYDYWEIGPPEGGKHKVVINAEIKFPIVSEKKQTILQGAFFYDIGSAWNNSKDITMKAGLGDDKLKRGYGFGIRFKTRVFPIRLDWGYGIDKRPKDSQWYFTLGDIF